MNDAGARWEASGGQERLAWGARLNWFTDLPSDHQIGVAVTVGIDGGADVSAVEAAVLGASRRFDIAPFRLADRLANRGWSVASTWST